MKEYIEKDWLLKHYREIGAYKAVLITDIATAPESAMLKVNDCQEPVETAAAPAAAEAVETAAVKKSPSAKPKAKGKAEK